MKVKAGRKRAAPASKSTSAKRRKVAQDSSRSKKAATKPKDKEKASERRTIPIPNVDDEDVLVSDQDLDVLETYGGAASFLNALDHKGISRSKNETERLHRLSKPVRQASVADSLPSIDSNGEEEEEEWTSGAEGLSSDDSGVGSGSPPHESDLDSDDDAEMPYEKTPYGRRPDWMNPEGQVVQRLPIKLANGHVQSTGTKPNPNRKIVEEDTSDTSEEEIEAPKSRVEDVSTGARFGRPAVIDVIETKSREARVKGAKEQIAGICQEIIADPENSIGLLRRLHTFSLEKISTPAHPDPVVNDPIIRKLAIISQLAVFKDIIPGYRIRALGEKEKVEKVSQMVARTREWEEGLVASYQSYLRFLEAELKTRSELAEVALRCMCTLLLEVTHFNFRVNLMSCIVAHLSKKSWDKMSDLCLDTIIGVFREDNTGAASLEIVRLLNRMVKERHFNVRPEVFSCLLHLRLKTELSVRASNSRADSAKTSHHPNNKKGGQRAGKGVEPSHISKKAKKALKEKKEIEKEFREAEAEVDKEERATIQTETLKLLFVLYFRILKSPKPTRLLPVALHGISKYAHLVNIDFFKDLMKVLKELIQGDSQIDEDDAISDLSRDTQTVYHHLLCIVTAFELLSGQGEALNVDLNDFIVCLYTVILPLSLTPDIESLAPQGSKNQSITVMLFRALDIIFSPRSSGATAPPWRSAAFAKRLLTASLHWPPATALRVLDFVGGLIAKDPKLEALLSTDDRTANGVYRPHIDDPQLSQPFGTSLWELHALARSHWDVAVREQARKLINFQRS
ncbi:nucleolar complex-associated protein 3 [Infundibulicybe gibba]|nr:nucleolar complex-associated protein 3 [Infundibulicybe gibba]